MDRTQCVSVAAVAALALSVSPVARAQAIDRAATAPASQDRPTTIALPSGLGRGVNFGNMLEAPSEGEWGLFVQEVFFDKAVEAGLDHIRLPVSWTHHADKNPPYAIDPVFMARVDWCVDMALARGLKIIVNNHHHQELNEDPLAEWPRALAIWQQIADHMKDRPETVYFEVLNEPHDAFNDQPQLWNQLLAESHAIIRATNPTRWVIAGPVRWNSVGALAQFDPPVDQHFITTIHWYEPFAFTHQGAAWITPTPPVGVTWSPSLFEIARPWDNWSWLTTITPARSGLSVKFENGWAGLQAHRDPALEQASKLVLAVDSTVDLRVVIGNDTVELEHFIKAGPGPTQHTIALPSNPPPITKIILQNNTPHPVAPFVLRELRVEGVPGESILLTQAESIARGLHSAAQWASSRGTPLHLGEFGAYSQGDMASRAAWTRTVRTSAEKLGIAWSYWELAAGFGFYEPESGQFREPLLQALVGP